MDMQAAIRAVTEHRDLSGEQMQTVMRTIMTGAATPAQIGGFLVGLRMKGETIDEIAAAAAKPKIGVVETISERTQRFHIVVSSSIDGDLAMDFAKKIATNGHNASISAPYGDKKCYRVTVGTSYDT